MAKLCYDVNCQQDFSFQGEALNFPTAFYGLWSSYNIKQLNVIKKCFFLLEIFFDIIPHTPYKNQSEKFCSQ